MHFPEIEFKRFRSRYHDANILTSKFRNRIAEKSFVS